MRRTALLSVLAFPMLHAQGQSPTWADDVACIVYSHCTSCHHPGAIGGEHLDLMTYASAALDAEFERITAAGAKALYPPRDEPWGMRSGYILDPDGNMIELSSWNKGE